MASSRIPRRSTTCRGKTSGKPLLEFDAESEAQDQARHDERKYGKRMYPYSCPACNKWHLAPNASIPSATDAVSSLISNKTSESNTTFRPHRTSTTCRGKASGTPLLEFDSAARAQEQADFDEKKYGKPMHPYNCGTCGRWHLSPSSQVASTNHMGSTSAPRKSSTCFGRASKAPLLEFGNEGQAREQATKDKNKYGNRMFPYMCAGCGKWHLAPNAPHVLPTSTKSATCRNSQGEGLSEYFNDTDASEAAKYCGTQLSADMVHYQCVKCRKWHISPADRQTQSRPWCENSCRDSKGALKDAYYTREDAERRAGILWQESNVRLRAYQCSETTMWHLTHKSEDAYRRRWPPSP